MINTLLPKIKAKYNLELYSHGKRKQISEALELLKSLYPYKVEKDSLSIRKLNEKNQYEVSVLDTPVKSENKIKSFVIIFSLLSVVIILSVLGINKVSEEKKLAVKMEEEIEKANTEKILLEKEKQKKLEQLEAEYHNLLNDKYDSVFRKIQFLNNNLIANSTIENITIDQKRFTIDVETKDAIQILANFEKSKEFSTVKMIRTTVMNDKEIVTFSGDFSKVIPDIDSSLDIESKINYYQNEINKINLYENKRIKVLSDYIKYIRQKLKENDCNEQYIQLKGSKDNIEVECFIYSTSKAILSFIDEIQNRNVGVFDISLFKLRNSSDSSKVQTTISFVSKISVTENEINNEYLDSIESINISEIEKRFYKKEEHKSINKVNKNLIIPTVIETTNLSYTQLSTVEQLPKLTYIGLTKKDGSTYILAKDNIFGTFYTILLVENEINDDCCTIYRNGYKAKINNSYYEVIK